MWPGRPLPVRCGQNMNTKEREKNVGAPALSSSHSHFIPSCSASCRYSLVASHVALWIEREVWCWWLMMVGVGGVAVWENPAPSSMGMGI